jgi:hypothetical protein
MDVTGLGTAKGGTNGADRLHSGRAKAILFLALVADPILHVIGQS